MALARMLGHTPAKVTLRVYADLFDTDLDAVAVTLDADSKCAQSVPKRRPQPPEGHLKEPLTCVEAGLSLGGGGGI